MAEERMTLLTAREAAQYLRVSMFTLNKIQQQGDLVPFRTPGGHRRYSLEMLNEYLESSRVAYNAPARTPSLAEAAKAVGSVAGGDTGPKAKELEREPEVPRAKAA